MNIVKRTYNGERVIPLEAELLEDRFVFLEGEITQECADELAKQLFYLFRNGNNMPIMLFINSEGGDIDAGLKICDTVSESPCMINVCCYGHAYSMAAVIYESVNGKRLITKNSKIMIHQPSVCQIPRKNAGELTDLSRQLNEKNSLLLSIISARSGITVKKLKKETAKDRFYDAGEAVSCGLADMIAAPGDILSFHRGNCEK